MFRKLKPVSLSILFAAMLLCGAHWALASSPSVPEESALTLALAGSARVSTDQRLIATTSVYTVHLPLIKRNDPIVEEFRGLWVTRFDWTRFGYTVTTSDLDTIVDRAASAHFNALLFQVRGTADAYYSSTLEPWAARLTGSTTKTLGADPGFDPLAYLIIRAHQSGLQVHAYLNIFPTWLCGVGAPPSDTRPQHLFWTLSHSTTWSDWRAYSDPQTPMNIATCADYLWATPALSLTRNHIVAVATDIVRRYGEWPLRDHGRRSKARLEAVTKRAAFIQMRLVVVAAIDQVRGQSMRQAQPIPCDSRTTSCCRRNCR